MCGNVGWSETDIKVFYIVKYSAQFIVRSYSDRKLQTCEVPVKIHIQCTDYYPKLLFDYGIVGGKWSHRWRVCL